MSSPSNAAGIASFDNIGLFDLPNGAIFQVSAPIAISASICCLAMQTRLMWLLCRSFSRLLLVFRAPFGATFPQFLFSVRDSSCVRRDVPTLMRNIQESWHFHFTKPSTSSPLAPSQSNLPSFPKVRSLQSRLSVFKSAISQIYLSASSLPRFTWL